VETSAGGPLFSMRPFAVSKWSAWLVSKDSPPVTPAHCPVTLQSATYLTAPLPSSSYRQHTKNSRVTKTLCSQYRTKTKRAGMPAYGQVGSATGDQ